MDMSAQMQRNDKKVFVKRTINRLCQFSVLTGRVSIPLLVSYPEPQAHAPTNKRPVHA